MNGNIVRVDLIMDIKKKYEDQRINIINDISILESRLRELRSNREAHDGAIAALDNIITLAETPPSQIGEIVDSIKE